MNTNSPLRQAVKAATAKVERDYILGALQERNWNRRKAARDLGISYRALLYKIKEHSLAVPVTAEELP